MLRSWVRVVDKAMSRVTARVNTHQHSPNPNLIFENYVMLSLRYGTAKSLPGICLTESNWC